MQYWSCSQSPISQLSLKEKATVLAAVQPTPSILEHACLKQLGHVPDFSASSWWLHFFMKSRGRKRWNSVTKIPSYQPVTAVQSTDVSDYCLLDPVCAEVLRSCLSFSCINRFSFSLPKPNRHMTSTSTLVRYLLLTQSLWIACRSLIKAWPVLV